MRKIYALGVRIQYEKRLALNVKYKSRMTAASDRNKKAMKEFILLEYNNLY